MEHLLNSKIRNHKHIRCKWKYTVQNLRALRTSNNALSYSSLSIMSLINHGISKLP